MLSLFSQDFQLEEGIKLLSMPKEGKPLRFCILEQGIAGYLYWTNDKRTVKSPTPFKETPNIQADTSPKQFAMMPVYDLQTGSISIFEMTAKGLLKFIMQTQKDGDFDLLDMSCGIKISATGSGMNTKYDFTITQLNPINGTKEEKEAALQEKVVQIKAAFNESDYFDGSWKEKVFIKTNSLTTDLKAAKINADDVM